MRFRPGQLGPAVIAIHIRERHSGSSRLSIRPSFAGNAAIQVRSLDRRLQLLPMLSITCFSLALAGDHAVKHDPQEPQNQIQ